MDGDVKDSRTLNKYAYANGNPVSYTDPFGTCADSFKKIGDFFGGIWDKFWEFREHNIEETEKMDIQFAAEEANSNEAMAKHNGWSFDWVESFNSNYNIGIFSRRVAGSICGGISDVSIGEAAEIAGAEEVGKAGGQGYKSFNALKKSIGSPGEGNQWHHIVEQTQIRKSGFTSYQINNTNNIIAIDKATHAQISGYYSSIDTFTDGIRVRDWLTGQSFESQYQFGIDVLGRNGVNP